MHACGHGMVPQRIRPAAGSHACQCGRGARPPAGAVQAGQPIQFRRRQASDRSRKRARLMRVHIERPTDQPIDQWIAIELQTAGVVCWIINQHYVLLPDGSLVHLLPLKLQMIACIPGPRSVQRSSERCRRRASMQALTCTTACVSPSQCMR